MAKGLSLFEFCGFEAAVANDPHHCYNGHPHCSNVDDGLCLDEEYANLSDAARAAYDSGGIPDYDIA